MSCSRDVVEAFGTAIRQLRLAQGWSQEELAARSDLNRSYLGEIERGVAIPSLLTMQKLAQALETSTALLLTRCEGIRQKRRSLSQ